MLVDDRPASGTVVVKQELIDITTEFEPDPTWVHTDSHGHEHRWVLDADDRLPTLVEVDDAEPHWCPDCQGDYQPWHYECRLCGDTVKPTTRRTIGRHHMRGLKHMTIEAHGDAALGVPFGRPVTIKLLTDPPLVATGQIVGRDISMDPVGGRKCVSHIVVSSAPIPASEEA
jgi:hypothetical protein